jgi:hypothetical protein
VRASVSAERGVVRLGAIQAKPLPVIASADSAPATP